jgi:ketosteroid isomerase-like protein
VSVSANATPAEETIRRCVEAFNQRTSEWVDRYYEPDVQWVEFPTRAAPQGRIGDRAALRAAAEAALAWFPDRQMEIRSLVAEGTHVAAELAWWGTAARALGDLQTGTTVRFRIASFFTVADGLIVKHTDYCVPDRAA